MADKVLRPVEYSDETQELLRNSLLKLNARIGDLGPIENVKGCSFNYQIFVNERGAKAVTDNHTEVIFLPLLIRVRTGGLWNFQLGMPKLTLFYQKR